jgi:hypothetical protein
MQSIKCLARPLACARMHAVVLFISSPSMQCVFKRRCSPTCPIASFEPSAALRVLQVHVHVGFIVAKFSCSHMPSE